MSPSTRIRVTARGASEVVTLGELYAADFWSAAERRDLESHLARGEASTVNGVRIELEP